MAYADPQSVTYNAVAQSLARVSSGVNSGRFYTTGAAGSDFALELSHQYGKRTRRMARLNVGLVNPSPYATGISAYESTSVYLVVDTPATNGIVDPAVAVLSVNALTGWLTATSNANALKLVQGQN
jgi:hypothetical protein